MTGKNLYRTRMADYMSFFASESAMQLVSLGRFRNLDWDIGALLGSSLLNSALQSSQVPIGHSLAVVPANTSIGRGDTYFTSDKRQRSMSPVQKIAKHDMPGYLYSSNEFLVFLDETGTALSSIGLKGEFAFDPNLEAFRAKSEEQALWTWAHVNAGIPSRLSDLRSKLIARQSENRRKRPDPLVTQLSLPLPMEVMDQLHLLLQAVNNEVQIDETENSNFHEAVLEPGMKWSLRPKPTTAIFASGPSIGDLSNEILQGNAIKGNARQGMPISTSHWLRDGAELEFEDPQKPGLVIAHSGDLITPSLGQTSRSRVARGPVAVGTGHYVIRLKPGVDGEAVNRFLNSAQASRQRREAVTHGAYLQRINKKDLLEFTFTDIVDHREACRELVERLLAK